MANLHDCQDSYTMNHFTSSNLCSSNQSNTNLPTPKESKVCQAEEWICMSVETEHVTTE
jgi:hypothetical protein